MNQTSIAILGAGSWGTAVAIHLANCGHQVLLWAHRSEHVAEMLQTKRNLRYLPNHEFPKNLIPVSDLNQCIKHASEVLIAVPSHAFHELLNHLPKLTMGLSWLTKGLDPTSSMLLSQLAAKKWGETYPVAMISGPSFAQELANRQPTALTIASNDAPYQHRLQNLIHHHNVRVYLSDDLTGVQTSGAVKNILAIACGVSDGLQYGANAKAALITRGLSEMSRLGMALGARQETFMGLAGVGDLVLTCTDNQSRNRRFGLLLGQGDTIVDAENKIGQVVEGKHNAAQVCDLARQYQTEMPICEEVHAIIQGKVNARQAAENLMNRPPKVEY